MTGGTPIAQRMHEDMDVDRGTSVTGFETMEQAGERIFAAILAAASGQRMKSETVDDGDSEFVPWQVGAVM